MVLLTVSGNFVLLIVTKFCESCAGFTRDRAVGWYTGLSQTCFRMYMATYTGILTLFFYIQIQPTYMHFYLFSYCGTWFTFSASFWCSFEFVREILVLFLADYTFKIGTSSFSMVIFCSVCNWQYCSWLTVEACSACTACSHFVLSSLIFWFPLFAICSHWTVWWPLVISLWLSALRCSQAFSRRVLMRILCPAQSLFSR